MRLSRRRFTELLAASGLAALLPDALPGPASADTVSSVDAWRRMLTAHQSGHHLMAPRAHITALADVLTDISTARRAVDPRQRRGLQQLEAEYAEHISWLYRESDDADSSWRWADRAGSLAVAAGDNALAAYMTLRRSTITLDRGDHAGRPSRAVTILQARLTALPGAKHRDRAVHLARLGSAHAADQAPDAAAIAGLGAVNEASRARSLHVIRDLRRLDTILTRWSRQPKVAEFHDALQTTARDLSEH